MIFDLNVSGLGTSVSNYLASLGPWFWIVGGLIVAANIVRFGINLLQTWQENQEDQANIAEWRERGWIDDDGRFTQKMIDEYNEGRSYEE